MPLWSEISGRYSELRQPRRPGLRANRQVVRRKSVAHTGVLQMGVQALGEGVVLRRVADEAGVELDRLAGVPKE
jgi:hypothetical protein